MGASVTISGSGNANVHIYGNGSVVAGVSGNDTITIDPHGRSGNGSVLATGTGNDTITIDGNGRITVGAGHDVLTLNGHQGYIQQNGANGNDTINLGTGRDSITEAGTATVHGAFGSSATIEGGKFQFFGKGTTSNPYQELAVNGKATLVGGGGSHSYQFIGGSGSVDMRGMQGVNGKSTDNTFIGGSGHATMTGGSGQNLFVIGCHGGIGGNDVITNFASGNDKLYLEGHSYNWLTSHGDISVQGGNTIIRLDGGQTTVTLTNFTGLSSGDVNTTHK
jgi:Ca2+-binding RTX toxin-like protein